MDTGLAIKPVAGVAISDYAPSSSMPAQQAVETDLASPASIAAASNSDRTGQDPQSSKPSPSRQPLALQPSQAGLSREYIIDAQTHEVVFRVMNTRTRQVVRQVPDEALLRMRACAQALARGQGVTADLRTNLSV